MFVNTYVGHTADNFNEGTYTFTKYVNVHGAFRSVEEGTITLPAVFETKTKSYALHGIFEGGYYCDSTKEMLRFVELSTEQSLDYFERAEKEFDKIEGKTNLWGTWEGGKKINQEAK